jgi:hypothetical protein
MSLWLGVIGPMALLGVSFAALVAPLTATVMSSLDQTDAGLASGVNNAVSRVAQLAGIALSAGIASHSFGYEIGMAVAAFITAMAASVIARKLPRRTLGPG